MTYDFSFDKLTLTIMLLGLVLVGILLFLVGWMVGANLNKPVILASNTSTSKTAAPSVPEQPVLPTVPVVVDVAPRRDTAALDETIAPSRRDTPAPGLDVEKEMPKAALPTGANADPVIIQKADPSTASAADPDEAEKNMAFSIQVGVFLEEKEANKLVREMESKGYSTSVFAANDAENRTWYSVRIGMYADQKEAAQAASSFTKQEKIKAVVRPIDSL